MMSSESWNAMPSAMPRSSRRSIDRPGVGEHPAQAARRGDQGGGLAPDDLHVGALVGGEAAGQLHLADLAIAERGDRAR
jgi:hypothetical protein